MHLRTRSRSLHPQHLGLCSFGLFLGNKTVIEHALNNVLLADTCAARILDGVIGRGCLGQTCQHRCLGDTDIFQGFTKIGFACSGKAIGAIAQINLVHIDFQNLVFAEVVL